jgi:hypothetical protein
MQPTAQAVGEKAENDQPRKGRKKILLQTRGFFPLNQTTDLNKNPSNSNKTRTAHNSICTGSLSTPPNNSDNIAPAPSRPAPQRTNFSHASHHRFPVFPNSFTQNALRFHLAQVETHVPPPMFSPRQKLPPTVLYPFHSFLR